MPLERKLRCPGEVGPVELVGLPRTGLDGRVETVQRFVNDDAAIERVRQRVRVARLGKPQAVDCESSYVAPGGDRES